MYVTCAQCSPSVHVSRYRRQRYWRWTGKLQNCLSVRCVRVRPQATSPGWVTCDGSCPFRLDLAPWMTPRHWTSDPNSWIVNQHANHWVPLLCAQFGLITTNCWSRTSCFPNNLCIHYNWFLSINIYNWNVTVRWPSVDVCVEVCWKSAVSPLKTEFLLNNI
jgi:hypothetical protein